MLVSETVATAIFTITRLLYASAFSVITVIIFSRLPGGSSTKFWYEQPYFLSKLASFFHPFGPTGKHGVRSTNIIAVVCLIITFSLNALPTALSKLSPIKITYSIGNTNDTLSLISNVFIPTLNEVSLPQLSVPSQSKNATTKFLCSHIHNGCTDANNNTVAEIVWDHVAITPVQFLRDSTQKDLVVSFGDSLATETAKPQFLQLAKDTLGDQTTYFEPLSFKTWNDNNLTGFISNAFAPNLENTTFGKYDILNSDQMLPLDTPDLSEMLKQGRRKGEPLPKNGDINRAERWTAIHRTSTLSTLLWQSANAHSGQIGTDWVTNCFFCQLIGIKGNSTEATQIFESLTEHPNNATKFNTFAIQSYVDQGFRLSTVLCTVEFNRTSSGLAYWCTHTFSQIWNVEHKENEYEFTANYSGTASETEQFSDQSSTPFPFFPPPTNITNKRTYVPVVPIFEIRSRGHCNTDWDFHNQTVQSWMKECAHENLGQLDSTNLTEIARNVWQLGSTITVQGFLVTAQHFTPNPLINISLAATIIIAIGAVLFVVANIVVYALTSSMHRRSLYEAIRMMVPDSREFHDVEKLLVNLAPINTLQLVESSFDKRIFYLQLNEKMIVAMSEDEMSQEDFKCASNKPDN
ncbi:hypothetical protein A0J61_02141 [Choanephora cucurbitarum]|uniref:Uncharacterized protein n=1 Tax=Choanephora cucurbitarum TaxID=101091 RepID=A0A1C7NL07_9FUNG|nr:hypothetical protein A0J61_02141 [Choanephora cucurbitarum]